MLRMYGADYQVAMSDQKHTVRKDMNIRPKILIVTGTLAPAFYVVVRKPENG
jgi:hypothetical protein